MHKVVVTPSTGMHPMANPRASVRASLWGETPNRSQVATRRLSISKDFLIMMESLSVGGAKYDSFPIKLW
jgi:hypothetical protein